MILVYFGCEASTGFMGLWTPQLKSIFKFFSSLGISITPTYYLNENPLELGLHLLKNA